MNGYVDFGNVKTTDNQIKKHYTMMTQDELMELRFIVSSNGFDSSRHFREKKYQHSHIKQVFSSYNIIEFNTNWKHDKINNRVLIRSNNCFLLKGKQYKLCLVVSITELTIVTGYYNYVGDAHDTIDMNRYEDFDIIDLLEYKEG